MTDPTPTPTRDEAVLPITPERLAEVRERFSAIPHAEPDSLTGHVKGMLALIDSLASAPAPASIDTRKITPADVVMWAVDRWNEQVKNRPLVNIHRRSLDDAWRRVMRDFGGDPDGLVGAPHDELHAACVPSPKGNEHIDAPAPASGRVDAVAGGVDLVAAINHAESELAQHIEKYHDYEDDTPERASLRGIQHHLMGSLIADDGSSLSPAATPVSEAGGGAADRLADKIEDIMAEFGADSLPIIGEYLSERRHALAQPASSPAGDADV